MDNEPKVIDLVLGTKIAGENKALATELLKNLLEKLPHDRAYIMNTYKQKQWPGLQNYLHKFYGGICYCGVPRLKFAVRNYEAALKHNVFDNIDDLHEQLIAEIDAVINEGQSIVSARPL